jgi:ANTAR domain
MSGTAGTSGTGGDEGERVGGDGGKGVAGGNGGADTGEVIGAQGVYFDVTATGEAREVSIPKAIADIADNRALIEQATGVLMYVYQVDADSAFDVLKWCSQETKVELCALAEQLLADIRTLGHDDGSRSYGSIFEFDRLLLTTHERIESQSSEE